MSHSHCCNNYCCPPRPYAAGYGNEMPFGGLLIPLLLIGLISTNRNRFI